MKLDALTGDLGPKWFHLAVRALVILAKSGDVITSSQLAEMLGSESTFLRKIMLRLAKNNLVTTYPGRYGGYSLAKPANDIKVLDVFQALTTTAPTPYYSVPSTGPEFYISMIVTKAEKAFQSVLEDFTIGELLNNES